jgi:hypothetical protein
VLIVAIESAAAAALDAHFRLHGGIPWFAYYFVFAAVTFLVGVAAFLFWLGALFFRGVERPTRHMLRTLGSFEWGETAIPLFTLPAFMASHTTFKAVIPHVTSFWADRFLADLDRLIFFGHDAWQVTHSVLGPAATLFIDRLYLAWFFVDGALLFAVAFGFRRYRGQVFLTYTLSWIVLGALGALVFASVGPCFYEGVHGEPRFAELMSRLQEQPLNAVRAQAKLWNDHIRDTVGFGSGISAMPSMHVSVAVITALFLRELKFGWLGWLWTAAIWLGSVHLGWHYATDGAVAAGITVIIWKLCGAWVGPGPTSPELRAETLVTDGVART